MNVFRELNMKHWILLVCCLLSLGPAAQARESVVYSVVGSDSKQPSTDIFAIDPDTGKSRLVFSDVKAQFALVPRDTAAACAKIFARAMGRNQYSNPGAVYELSVDGSGRARKIFDVENEPNMTSNFSNLFVNHSGSKIGHLNTLGGKSYLFVHDAATGKLLRKTDVTSIMPGNVTSIGWMPDDERIFFTLNDAGEDADWQDSRSPIGSYVMKEDADRAVRIAPEAAMHPQLAGLRPLNDTAAVLIAGLKDGQYLAYDLQRNPALRQPSTYLYELDVAAKTQKLVPTDIEGKLLSFHLSPSGQELTLTATQKKYEKQAQFTWTTTQELWTLDLDSGRKSKLQSFTSHDDGPPSVNLIGWLDQD